MRVVLNFFLFFLQALLNIYALRNTLRNT